MIVFAKHSPLASVASVASPTGEKEIASALNTHEPSPALALSNQPGRAGPLTSLPPGLPNQPVLESRQCRSFPLTLGPAKSSSSSSMSTASSPTESSSYFPHQPECSRLSCGNLPNLADRGASVCTAKLSSRPRAFTPTTAPRYIRLA